MALIGAETGNSYPTRPDGYPASLIRSCGGRQPLLLDSPYWAPPGGKPASISAATSSALAWASAGVLADWESLA